MEHEKFMRNAIEKAQEGIRNGQTPFGACIVKDNRIVSLAHNRVWATIDITAHAEIVAIREACHALNTIDLSGCTIYSTCEPCPMCFSAIHWAKIDGIYFGATIANAKEAGFNELSISNNKMQTLGGSPVEVKAGILETENNALFQTWRNAGGQDRRY